MPRIPTITAEGGAAVVQYPARVQVQDYTGAYNFGQNLSEFSNQLNRIAHTLKKQQDDIDTSELIGIFHGSLKENELAVRKEDPLERAAKFAELMNGVKEELMGRARSKNVAASISEYVNKHLPFETAKVHGDALKYMSQEAVAKVDAMTAGVIKMASEAENPTERNKIIDYHLKDIDGLVKSGSLTPTEGQNKKEHASVRAEDSFARHLARVDYEAFKDQDEAGAFANVPTRDLDVIKKQAEATQTTKYNAADKARVEAVKGHHDGVMRYLIQKRAAGTLEQADILEWQDILHPNELEHMNEEFRKMSLGINTGDTKAQIDTQEDFRDTKLDLEARIKSVHWLRQRGLLDQDEYRYRLTYLDAERVRVEGYKRADQNSAESKMASALEKRHNDSESSLKRLFQVTGPFEKFSFAMATIEDQALRMYQSLSKARNGQHEPETAANRVRAYYLPIIPQRLDPLVESFKAQLAKYPTKKSLEAAEGTMSPTDFHDLTMAQIEYYKIRAYIENAKMQGKLPTTEPVEVKR